MDLNKIRREIDRIDNSILRALQRRIEWGRLTLKFKKKILSPEREQAIVNSLMERERSLLSSEVIEAIYQTIFTESRRVQAEARPLIAFQGEHGAFTKAVNLSIRLRSIRRDDLNRADTSPAKYRKGLVTALRIE